MLEKGSVVKSVAGRDAGKLMLVTSVSEQIVMVCDGKERPVERPKHKNPRHLYDTGWKLEMSTMPTNRVLRKALAEIAQRLS